MGALTTRNEFLFLNVNCELTCIQKSLSFLSKVSNDTQNNEATHDSGCKQRPEREGDEVAVAQSGSKQDSGLFMETMVIVS